MPGAEKRWNNSLLGEHKYLVPFKFKFKQIPEKAAPCLELAAAGNLAFLSALRTQNACRSVLG